LGQCFQVLGSVSRRAQQAVYHYSRLRQLEPRVYGLVTTYCGSVGPDIFQGLFKQPLCTQVTSHQPGMLFASWGLTL
jgi:hypothetical protein